MDVILYIIAFGILLAIPLYALLTMEKRHRGQKAPHDDMVKRSSASAD